MKKTAVVALLMIVVLLVSATAGFAWSRGGGGGGVRHGGWSGGGGGGWHGGHGGFHGRGVVVVGPGCCWGPWWWGGWGWPGPVYVQPQVVVQPAPVIIDRWTQGSTPQESYWYFCPSTRAYYPNVSSCSEVWIKVPPRSE